MNLESSISALIAKYDTPTPRYTSYPTVPYWDKTSINEALWKENCISALKENDGKISLYIHLPFCETLCTYCGCNKRITKNHAVEMPYLEAVLKEWEMYKSIFNQKPIIQAIHLGGGTPTFFSAENLEFLLSSILNDVEVAENKEFSIEVHPSFTNVDQLQALSKLGFERISLGVQDFSEEVQFIINRPQTVAQTNFIVQEARKFGFKGVNVDLVYGLPKQTLQSIEYTINEVIKMQPERIAFYSYAHVPWKSAGQRRYKDEDVPAGAEKRALYELGRKLLLAFGYQEIGMDHFALPGDELLIADENGTLHRNFMGYTTTQRKGFLLGLGVSSISDSWSAFMQNVKEVESYQEKLQNNELPLLKGHLLSEKDKFWREKILNLMCQHEVKLSEIQPDELEALLIQLAPIADDQLISLEKETIKVNETGKMFIRNIAQCFDERHHSSINKVSAFSKSV